MTEASAVLAKSREDCLAADAADPLRGFRDRFTLPDGVLYLDGNSLGPLPVGSADRVRTVVEEEWGRGLIRSNVETFGLTGRTKIFRRDATSLGEAGTVAEAIQVVSELQPDIVLMDIRLPDQSGIAACQQVRRWRISCVLAFRAQTAADRLGVEAFVAGLVQEAGEEVVVGGEHRDPLPATLHRLEVQDAHAAGHFPALRRHDPFLAIRRGQTKAGTRFGHSFDGPTS